MFVTVLRAFVICLISLICYAFLAFRYDRAALRAEQDRLAEKLYEGSSVNKLLNGSGIDNIPGIKIQTTNRSVAVANRCGQGPVYLGDTGTDADCVRICANSSGKAIRVVEGETYAYDSQLLQPGVHCTIGPRPECDAHNSYVLMTINSVVCRSKFPGIIGGPLGSVVIACNNTLIDDPQNYLWDYKTNEKFDPARHTLVDENERLQENGEYRYRCKFNGSDERENAYIEHPTSRFHPIRNYCASATFRAPFDVRTVFERDETGRVVGFHCDCGEHLKNLDPNDRSSLCSTHQDTDTVVTKHKRRMTKTYECFTLFSPITHVGDRFPCGAEKFTREGSQSETITLDYTYEQNEPIEHPLYEKFRAGLQNFEFSDRFP